MNDILFLAVLFGAGVLRFTFRKQIQERLAYRIAAMVFAVSIVMLLVVILGARIFFGSSFPSQNDASPPLALLIAFFSMPFLVGILGSWLINRPLKQFTSAIQSLEENQRHTELSLSGIREFDEVFADFNRLTARLQKEEELRKDLISDTSHELNTPLTAMLGQLVAMQEETLPVTKKRIGVIREQTERLIDLVQQLDTYTKARIPPTTRNKAIGLKAACRQAFVALDSSLKEQHVVTEIKIAEDLYVEADPAALRQILINFIQNTLRYAEATKITIAANRNGMTYYDNGKGVPADSLPHLFERFYRVDPSRSRETGGLGLGLAIVAELAEQQGWQVRAEAAHTGLAIVIQFNR